MISEIIFPGWRFSSSEEKLYGYQIIFNQLQSYEDLESKILRGEYFSEVPFGLQKSGSNYTILFTKKYSKRLISIKIGDNFGVIKKRIMTPFKIKPIGIKTLLKTAFDIVLNENGFKKPYHIRGCLGKYSKGILSKRADNIFLKKSETGLDQDYYIAPAVQIDIFYLKRKNEFFISFLPKFEVFTTDFQLPLNELKKQILFENKLFQKIIKKEPEDYFKEFIIINKNITNSSIIKPFFDISPIKPFKLNMLLRPNNFKIKNNVQKLENVDKQNIPEFLQLKMRSVRLPNIRLYIECELTGNEKIKEFLDYLKKNRLIKILSTKNFERNSRFMSNIEKTKDPILIIMNKPSKKRNDYFYSILKNSKKRNKKIITSQNIIEGSFYDWEGIINSINLSLFYRQTQKSLIHLEFENLKQYSNIYSFNFVEDFQYFIKILYSGCYDLNSNIYKFYINYFPWRYENSHIIQTIRKNVNERTLFLLFTDFHQDKFNELLTDQNEEAIIVISRLKGKLIEKNDNCFYNPKSGSYIQLSKNTFILITTGYPDLRSNSDKVFNPVPLRIEFLNFSEDIVFVKLLNHLYLHTFCNLLTTSKNQLPEIINVLKKLPSKYNLNSLKEINMEENTELYL